MAASACVTCGLLSSKFYIYLILFLLLFYKKAHTVRHEDGNKSNQKEVNYMYSDIDRPIQLVRPDESHEQLVVDKASIEYLRNVRGAVATVVVVGKYHSGKSFLLNQLMRKSSGFGIGSTIDPQTMGIWMWGKPLQIRDPKTGEKLSVIFLDTEGFTANNISETYDAKIFAVGTLLSSYLIYNSVKIIDQSDIDYLELLSRRTRLFALRSQLSKGKWTSEFNRDLLSFPPLLWVVQDFVQATNDETPTKWLHRLMSAHVREDDNYEISLLRIFDRVDCHTLFIPATKKHLLMDLSQAREEDLTDDYKQERDNLLNWLFTNMKPKEKNHKPITGPELATLLEILVSAANEGSLNDVPTRWNSFMARLRETATEDCVKFYEVEMDALQQKYKNNPINPLELEEWHEVITRNSIQLLDQLLYGLSEAIEKSKQDLLATIGYRYETKKELNMKRIHIKCAEVRHELELDLEQNFTRLSLPDRTANLEKAISLRVHDTMRKFTNAVTSFAEGGVFDNCVGNLEKSLNQMGDGLMLKNHQLIETFFKNSVQAALDLYSNLTKSPSDQPRTHNNLKLLLIEAERRSVQEYERLTQSMEGESLLEPFRAHLLNNIKSVGEKRHDENQKLVATFAEKLVKTLHKELQERTSEERIQLPMNKPDLDKKLKSETSLIEQKYVDATSDFRLYSSIPNIHDKLLHIMAEHVAQKRQDNMDAYTKEVKGPLSRAKEIILLMSDPHSTAFGLRQYMHKVCLLNLDEGLAKTWSKELKEQIVEHFIESDTDLQQKLKDKQGLWSSIVGFFQWLLYILNLF